MAKFEYSGPEELEQKLAGMERGMIKGIVMSGAEACTKEMQAMIGAYRHVKTGSMQRSVAPGNYHETMNGGWVDVYPQGEDGRGVSNAKKAFVINYGYGGRKTKKTGDKFITGNQKKMEQGVFTAMQAESDRRIAELNK